jgi:hypothetical protein
MARTRVLLEHENPRVLEAQAADLEAAGFEVRTCPGPIRLESRICPLVAHGRCPAAHATDVIVNGLPIEQLGIYVAQRTWLTDRAVLLSLTPQEQARHPIIAGVATPIPRNVTGDILLDAVRSAANPAGAAL